MILAYPIYLHILAKNLCAFIIENIEKFINLEACIVWCHFK